MASTFTSNLGKILENINRTSYGSNEAIRNMLASAQGEEEFKPLESFQKGVTLEKKTLGGDIISEMFGEAVNAGMPEKIARGIAGFTIDVLADPLTYVGIGGTTKLGKLAQKVTGLTKEGRTIAPASRIGQMMQKYKPDELVFGGTLSEQAAKGQRAAITFMGQALTPKGLDAATLGLVEQAKNWAENAPAIGNFIKGAKNLFSTKTGVPELDEAIHKWHGTAQTRAKAIEDQLKTIAKQAGKLNKEEADDIINYIYGKQGRQYSPKVIETGDALKVFFKEIAQVEMDKAVLGKTIDNYFPGVATGEFKGFLKTLAGRKGMSETEFNAKLQFAEEKLLTKEMTISEANKVISMVIGSPLKVDDIQDEIVKRLSNEARKSLQGIQDIAREKGVKELKGTAFEGDPFVASLTRGIASARAVSTKTFIDDVKKMGVSAEDWRKMAPDMQKNYTQSSFKEMEGQYFDKRVAEALERSHKAIFNQKELNDVVNAYKGAINFWKRWTLSIFPEYHSRNVAGNVWNNYISAGIKSVDEYARAAMIQKNPEKFILKTSAGETLTGSQILDEMRKYGVLQSGAAVHEVPEKVAERFKGPTLNPLSERNVAIRAGRAVGETLEDNAKIAHYIVQRRRGLSNFDAAMSVKSALFDYSDLTDFERNVMRFIFPFYSWSRKNIPLQVSQLIKQPGKFSQIAKGKEEIEGQAGTQDIRMKWMPEWMQKSFPIILSRMPKDEQYKVLLLSSWLPAGDIDKLFEPGRLLTSSLEPISKEVMQQFMNKDFFTDKDIVDYPGEVENFLGIDLDPRIKHALKGIRLLNTIDQINPGGAFGQEGGQKSVFGGQRRMIDLSTKEKVAKYTAGFKLYPYDVKKGKTYKVAKLRGQIAKLKYQLKVYRRRGDVKNIKAVNERIKELRKQQKG